MAGNQRGKLVTGYEEIRQFVKTTATPFGKISKEKKKSRKKRALTDLKYFAKIYFPHHLTGKNSAMHLDLYERFQAGVLDAKNTGKGFKQVQAAPRGNAKSTLTTLILPLWCIAAKHRQFIGVISDTTEQAEEFLETIKAEFEVNERLAEDFPQSCGRGPTWQIGKILTRNGVKITGWGKRKRLRGARFGNQRPDLVICDDLEDDENIDSPEQREKDRRWFFKAVMKIGGKCTVYIVIGTIIHYDSLVARLLKQPGWVGRKWSAVIRWSHSPLWEKWEQIYSEPGNSNAEREADEYF